MKVILLDTEEGYGSVADLIKAGKVERYDCRKYENFEKAYWALAHGHIKGDYVVVDTVDSVTYDYVRDITLDPTKLNPLTGQTIWNLRTKTRQSQDVWNVVNYGIPYVLTGIRNLPIPSMFLVHEKEREDFTDDRAEVRRSMPGLPRQILANVLAESDLILRMYKTNVPTMNGSTTYPANTRVLQLENTADVYTGSRLIPEENDKLPKLIYEPTLAKLHAAIGYLPKKLTCYSFPKVGKTVFGCTLPS